ncbi:hypothetical protein LPJ57_007675, partial [Coemansia sp. RSA 486]
SLGAAISWQLDARNVAFKTQLAVNWALLDVSSILMFYLSFKVQDTADVFREYEDEAAVKAGISEENAVAIDTPLCGYESPLPS